MNAATLHGFDQRAETAIAGKQHDLIDILGQFHRIDRNLDMHVALDLNLAVGIDELFGGLRDNRVAIVVEPVDQRTNRGIFLIFNYRRVIEGTHQRAATRKFVEKPFVVDIKSDRSAGRIEVCPVDE
jgi:hypothetical protein